MKYGLKKITAAFIAVVMLLSIIPVIDFNGDGKSNMTVEAVEDWTSGYCGGDGDGTNLSYTIDTNGVLTITGEGSMMEKPKWNDDLRVKSVVLPEGIEKISKYAFSGCSNLKDINLPDSVKTISNYAFNKCTSLDTITIPESVIEIQDYAFYECTALTSITINSNILTSLGESCFQGCKKIKTIDLPDSVTKISKNCFRASGLTEFTFPPKVKKISFGAFQETSLANIIIPDTVTTVEREAFYKLKAPIYSIIIGKNIKTLPVNCIVSDVYSTNVNYITELTIPENIETMESNAISVGSITKAYIGKGLKNFNSGFSETGKLQYIDVDPENTYIHSHDNALWNSDYSEIIWYNRYRTTLEFPKELKGFNRDYINSSASRLKEYSIEDGAENFSVIDGILYQKDIESGKNTTLYRCPREYSSKVIVPETVTTIHKFAFAWANKVEIEFNGNIKTIEQYAFCHAGKGELCLTEGIESVENGAFYDCNFTSVRFPENTLAYGNWFNTCQYLKRIYLGAKTKLGKSNSIYGSFGSSSEYIEVSPNNPDYSSYYGSVFNKDYSELITVPFKLKTVRIHKNTQDFVQFPQNNEATVIVDNDNQWYKSDGLFLLNKEGTELYRIQSKNTDVVIPAGVKKLAQKHCVTGGSAKSIVIPEGFEDIVDHHLSGGSLEKAVIPGSVKTINGFGSSALTDIQLGEGIENVIEIGEKKLNKLTLPSSCKYYTPWYNQYSSYENLKYSEITDLTVKNPNCVINEWRRFKEGIHITAYCGSPAHEASKRRKGTFTSLGHSYLDWYVSTPATYTSEGVERRDCAYCDHSESRPIPKLVKSTHTATFMADGKVVSVVNFTSAMDKIEEPTVPAKDRYLGEWEPYTLGDEDIVINAKYTLIKAEDAQDIDAESNIDYYYNTDDIQFNIKASSKAKTVKSIISQSIPLDIVLVVDQSGSMDETLGGSKKKVDALKEAATSFVNQVANNAKQTGADHRIAIAGFGLAGNFNGYQKNENTELLTNAKGVPIVYHEIKPADYSSALINVLDGNSVNTSLTNAISSIEARGATAADLGLEMAKSIYANTDSAGRERVVIFMTDGEPTYQSSFQTAVANTAINNASVLKNTFGTSIYSLGVFGTATSKINQFMNAVSSDYPNAVSYNNLGIKQSSNYYTTVSNTDALSDVFHTITTESLSHTALFDKLTLIKTLSKYVTLTSKQEQDLRVSLIRRYGVTNNDIKISRKENGTTEIKVENLTPYEVDNNGNIKYEASISFFASLNQNAKEAGEYTVDTEDSGVMLGETNGYEATFKPSTVTLEKDKTRTVYKINNEVYDICEDGKAPDTSEFPSDWSFSGWSGDSKEKTATLIKAKRTVVWTMSDETVTQTYEEGSIIIPPKAKDKSESEKFLSWNKSIPTVMPDENLEFTAVYGGHVHKYSSEIITPVTCESDGLTKYTCDCGDSHEETVSALGHHFEAVTSSKDKNSDDASRCTFVCTSCGQKYNYALNYQVREASLWTSWSRMLFEFDLTDDNLDIGMQPDGKITIRIPLTELQYQYARNVYVTRTENGRRVQVPAEIQDGYLIIQADHFSPYEINFIEEDAYITSDNKTINLNDAVNIEADDILAKENGYSSLSNFRLLGVQKKDKDSENKDIRFVSVANSDMLKDASEYGFLIAHTKSKSYTEARDLIGSLTYNGSNIAKQVCTRTSNKISGNYGIYDEDTKYKYVTLAIDNIPDNEVVMARFYVKKNDGTIYYSKYINKSGSTYDGCAMNWATLEAA